MSSNQALKAENHPVPSVLALPSISVVIPTLNEEQNLAWLLPRLPHWVYEVIVVDGFSSDNTVSVARELRPDIRIIMEKRHGKGVALCTGIASARGEIVVTIDADGSMDPSEMIRFVSALLSGADFAKGTRFAQGAGTDDMSAFRMLGNWGLMQTVRMLFGGSFSDLCYGYNAFWTKHRSRLEPDCDGFEIETLLMIRALKAELKIVEVPSFESNRRHGLSNLNAISDGWRILKTIVRERMFDQKVHIAAND